MRLRSFLQTMNFGAGRVDFPNPVGSHHGILGYLLNSKMYLTDRPRKQTISGFPACRGRNSTRPVAVSAARRLVGKLRSRPLPMMLCRTLAANLSNRGASPRDLKNKIATY